jgi:hypothetical protein
MPRIIIDGQCLAFAIWIDELSNDQALILDAMGISDCQGIPLYCLYRPPHVDDLHSALEESFSLIRKVMWYTAKGCGV